MADLIDGRILKDLEESGVWSTPESVVEQLNADREPGMDYDDIMGKGWKKRLVRDRLNRTDMLSSTYSHLFDRPDSVDNYEAYKAKGMTKEDMAEKVEAALNGKISPFSYKQSTIDPDTGRFMEEDVMVDPKEGFDKGMVSYFKGHFGDLGLGEGHIRKLALDKRIPRAFMVKDLMPLYGYGSVKDPGGNPELGDWLKGMFEMDDKAFAHDVKSKREWFGEPVPDWEASEAEAEDKLADFMARYEEEKRSKAKKEGERDEEAKRKDEKRSTSKAWVGAESTGKRDKISSDFRKKGESKADAERWKGSKKVEGNDMKDNSPSDMSTGSRKVTKPGGFDGDVEIEHAARKFGFDD